MNPDYHAHWKTEGTNFLKQLANSRQGQKLGGTGDSQILPVLESISNAPHNPFPLTRVLSTLLGHCVSNPLALLLVKSTEWRSSGFGWAVFAGSQASWGRCPSALASLWNFPLLPVHHHFHSFHFSFPGVVSYTLEVLPRCLLFGLFGIWGGKDKQHHIPLKNPIPEAGQSGHGLFWFWTPGAPQLTLFDRFSLLDLVPKTHTKDSSGGSHWKSKGFSSRLYACL